MMKIVKEDPVPIRTHAPDLPAALVNAVNKALQKDPDRRFMHAGDFGAELRLVRLSLERTTETIHEDPEAAATLFIQAGAAPAQAPQPRQAQAAGAHHPAAGAS